MSKKPSGIIDEETMRRELCTAAYLMARNRKWDLTEEDFTIDENLNFTHATWRGIFAKVVKLWLQQLKLLTIILRNAISLKKNVIYHLFTS